MRRSRKSECKSEVRKPINHKPDVKSSKSEEENNSEIDTLHSELKDHSALDIPQCAINNSEIEFRTCGTKSEIKIVPHSTFRNPQLINPKSGSQKIVPILCRIN